MKHNSKFTKLLAIILVLVFCCHCLTACNSMWSFITTNFTSPRTLHIKWQCAFRHIQTFRLVHSEVRQCGRSHILTMSI